MNDKKIKEPKTLLIYSLRSSATLLTQQQLNIVVGGSVGGGGGNEPSATRSFADALYQQGNYLP
ncbi:hypothetical protein [Pseudoalteromonas sp. MMG012]|uniref:hypothetical protein n=1 Tax=Pseudoalteromonas sp. MMG012 TaxID=2822686 RepID=UPI001B39D6C4|nr:hypothetical protein [Pseudoalteromonas sp. MMG012]MBQ4852954.1 hypothetical protein [Pseudoalteromonas sp. MMG012]